MSNDPPPGLDRLDPAWLSAKPGMKWQKHGPGVLAAWVADMDFPIPEPVHNALVRMVDRSDLGYPHWGNSSPLAEAFAARMRERFGWAPDPAHVRDFNDIIQGLEVMLFLATRPGEAVAMHTPAYPPFLKSLEHMGRPLVPIPMESDGGRWVFDHDRLAAVLKRGDVRALVLVNPHNPTGRVFTRAELEGLAELAARHDLLVISDEVHADLTYPPHSHLPFAALDEATAVRTVTLTSATKAFNLAGIRCAVAHVGVAALRETLAAHPRYLFGVPNLAGVTATLAAWTDGAAWLEAVVDYLDGNRRLIGEAVATRLGGVSHHPPEATYLAWLDFRAHDAGPDPAALLLDRANVALSPGTEFGPGGEGFARLNFATSAAVLDEILERVTTTLSR